MKRRGRPRHPDILTPREWEVLELLRDGLSNPEMAERLGISRDAVKYHVSEILSKLGLSSREEAAVWQPYERPWWAGAVAAATGVARRLSPLGRIAAIGASLAALAGLAFLALGLLTSGEPTELDQPAAVSRQEELPRDVTPVTATNTQTPRSHPEVPAFLRDRPMEPLLVGADLEFPTGVAVLFEVGCTGCDGPSYGVARAYRPAAGDVVFDVLFWTNSAIIGSDEPHNSLGLPEPNDASAYWLTGVAARPDGSEIFVTVCCDPFRDGDTLVVRSTDGGVTWDVWQRLPHTYAALQIISPDRLLVGTYAFGDDVPLTVLPDGETIAPPVEGALPAIVNGELLWVSQEGVHRDDQLLLATGDSNEDRQISIHAPSFSPSGESALASVYQSERLNPPYSTVVNYLAEIRADWTITRSFFSPDHHLSTDVWLDENRVFTTVGRNPNIAPGGPFVGPFEGRSVPGIIDISSGAVHAIPNPFADEYTTRRAIAIQYGPLARVVNTDGTCLNIRAEPDASAVVDCAAEGVLLTDLGQTADAQGVTWLRVATPAGVEGWASTQYLER